MKKRVFLLVVLLVFSIISLATITNSQPDSSFVKYKQIVGKPDYSFIDLSDYRKKTLSDKFVWFSKSNFGFGAAFPDATVKIIKKLTDPSSFIIGGSAGTILGITGKIYSGTSGDLFEEGTEPEVKLFSNFDCSISKNGFTTTIEPPGTDGILPNTARITRILTRGCTTIKINGNDLKKPDGSLFMVCSDADIPGKIYGNESEGWIDLTSQNIVLPLNPNSNEITLYSSEYNGVRGKGCIEIEYDSDWRVFEGQRVPSDCLIQKGGEESATISIHPFASEISAQLIGIAEYTELFVNENSVYKNDADKNRIPLKEYIDFTLSPGTNTLKIKNLKKAKNEDTQSCAFILYKYRVSATAGKRNCTLYHPNGTRLWTKNFISDAKACIDECIDQYGQVKEECQNSGDYTLTIAIPQPPGVFDPDPIGSCDSLARCNLPTTKSFLNFVFKTCNKNIFPQMTGIIGDNGKAVCNGMEWIQAGQMRFKIIPITIGGITYDYVSNRNQWIKCDSPGKTVPVPSEATESDINKVARFVCHHLGANLFFSECCGNSFSDCENDYPKAKITGTPTTIIADFNDKPSKTKIISYNGVSFNEYSLYLDPEFEDVEHTDSDITDWRYFSNLDFFIKFRNTFNQNLMLYDGNDNLILNVKITDFALNTPELNKWLHISIPLSLLTEDGKKDVKKISFSFISPTTESNTVEIDKIFLVPTNISELRYCTAASRKPGSIDNFWLEDLDNANLGMYNEKAGESACNSIPSYAWTGTKCCGDDNYNKNEYYADNDNGCWQGNLMSSKTSPTATSVMLRFNNQPVNYYCSNPFNCTFPIFGSTPSSISKVSADNVYLLSHNQKLSLPQTTSDRNALIIVENPKQQVIAAGNKLYGCNADPLLIALTPPGLVEQTSYFCTMKQNFSCSPNSGWTNLSSGSALGYERDTLKHTPLNSGITSSDCCPQSYCWNSTQCIASQHASPQEYSVINNNHYRCINGEWGSAVLKYDWNRKEWGFCPQTNQCLVDVLGNASNNENPFAYSNESSKNPQCIDNTKYIDDHYCLDGEWTSRTKLIAESMLKSLKTSSPSFTLYCDNAENALNEYDYRNVKTILKGSFKGTINRVQTCSESPKYVIPCMNNFCLLTFIDAEDNKQKTVIATSLNKPIDYNIHGNSFLTDVLGKNSASYCDSLINSSQDYKKCNNNDNTLWYSDLTNSIIYSQYSINLEEPSIWQSILNSFKEIFSWITGNWKPKNAFNNYINLSMLEKTKDYNRIYIASKGNKRIYAIMETPEPGKSFITAKYEGFTVPFCETIKAFDSYSPGQTVCNQTGTTYYIYSDEPDTIWQELTSKLRLG